MSTTGSVFGIATIAQYPPAAAASVPEAIVSSSSRPGVQVHVRIDERGREHEPGGRGRDRLEGGHEPVLDRHVRGHVESRAGVDDAARTERVEAPVAAREHHATSSATAATPTPGAVSRS